LMGVDKLGWGWENFCRDRIGMKLWDQEWYGGNPWEWGSDEKKSWGWGGDSGSLF